MGNYGGLTETQLVRYLGGDNARWAVRRDDSTLGSVTLGYVRASSREEAWATVRALVPTHSEMGNADRIGLDTWHDASAQVPGCCHCESGDSSHYVCLPGHGCQDCADDGMLVAENLAAGYGPRGEDV